MSQSYGPFSTIATVFRGIQTAANATTDLLQAAQVAGKGIQANAALYTARTEADCEKKATEAGCQDRYRELMLMYK